MGLSRNQNNFEKVEKECPDLDFSLVGWSSGGEHLEEQAVSRDS